MSDASRPCLRCGAQVPPPWTVCLACGGRVLGRVAGRDGGYAVVVPDIASERQRAALLDRLRSSVGEEIDESALAKQLGDRGGPLVVGVDRETARDLVAALKSLGIPGRLVSAREAQRPRKGFATPWPYLLLAVGIVVGMAWQPLVIIVAALVAAGLGYLLEKPAPPPLLPLPETTFSLEGPWSDPDRVAGLLGGLSEETRRALAEVQERVVRLREGARAVESEQLIGTSAMELDFELAEVVGTMLEGLRESGSAASGERAQAVVTRVLAALDRSEGSLRGGMGDLTEVQEQLQAAVRQVKLLGPGGVSSEDS